MGPRLPLNIWVFCLFVCFCFLQSSNWACGGGSELCHQDTNYGVKGVVKTASGAGAGLRLTESHTEAGGGGLSER